MKKEGVGVMVFRDGKVLLGRRCEGWAVGTWTLPGGKLELNENYMDGAKREVLEETGLIIDNLELISVKKDKIGNRGMYKTFGVLAHKAEGEAEAKEPDEIDKWEWFDPKNLPQPIFVPAKKIIDVFLSRSE